MQQLGGTGLFAPRRSPGSRDALAHRVQHLDDEAAVSSRVGAKPVWLTFLQAAQLAHQGVAARVRQSLHGQQQLRSHTHAVEEGESPLTRIASNGSSASAATEAPGADAAAVPPPPLTLLLLLEADARALPLDKRCFFAADFLHLLEACWCGALRGPADCTGVKLDRSWQHICRYMSSPSPYSSSMYGRVRGEPLGEALA